jgi:hypothetical protein
METIQQAGISAPPRRAVYMEIRKEPILLLYRIFSIKKHTGGMFQRIPFWLGKRAQ